MHLINFFGFAIALTTALLALPTPGSGLEQQVDPVCSQGYIDCINGYVRGTATSTCASACGASCCTGDYACYDFTGKVCKDGTSCNGSTACIHAIIPYVVNSCNGNAACNSAGAFGGSVGSFVKSCRGDFSCTHVGYGNGGSTGNISSSCNAPSACTGLGYVNYGAVTSNLNNCCNTPNACIHFDQRKLPGTCLERVDEEVQDVVNVSME